jgi:methionyl-tRNA formyltransferase
VKIVFLGTPRVAVPSLEALLDAGHAVPLVVTQPDRPVRRSRQPVAPPVKEAALAHGIDVLQPLKVRTRAFREALAAAEPEALVVVAYGRILTTKALEIAPHGAINVHFSLLPLYRGAAPVQWALANGDDVTGVTTMQINEKMDEGDVLLEREVPIAPGEHAPALQERLSVIGAELLLETLDGVSAGTVTPRPQDHDRATTAPLLAATDGEVDPGLPARTIEGRIRGFDPWPGVWVSRAGKRLRLLEGAAVAGASSGEAAGTVVGLEDGGLAMVCGGGTLLALERVQPEGRRALSIRDAINGRQLVPGDRLEPLGARAS